MMMKKKRGKDDEKMGETFGRHPLGWLTPQPKREEGKKAQEVERIEKRCDEEKEERKGRRFIRQEGKTKDAMKRRRRGKEEGIVIRQ